MPTLLDILLAAFQHEDKAELEATLAATRDTLQARIPGLRDLPAVVDALLGQLEQSSDDELTTWILEALQAAGFSDEMPAAELDRLVPFLDGEQRVDHTCQALDVLGFSGQAQYRSVVGRFRRSDVPEVREAASDALEQLDYSLREATREERPWAVFEPLLRLIGLSASRPAARRLVLEYSMDLDDSSTSGTYWEAPAAGIGFLVEDGDVDTIFLHAAGRDDFAEYRGPLPAWLTFQTPRSTVLAFAGPPTIESPPAGDRQGWDRFDLASVFVHLTYEGDGSGISLIALGRKTVWGGPIS